jgi:magnesium chelatase family protein
LRQPLEERAVRISRQGVSLAFPAAFQLVACSNPCPCGSGGNECRCSDAQRDRYRRRLSAPLLDRFDLRVRVDAPEPCDVAGESSSEVAARVAVAYERQRARYADWPWMQNAHVAAGAVPRLLPLGPDADEVWRELIADRQLTGRGATRIRRVARTLADLDDSAGIGAGHLETAASMRGDVP